MILQEHLFNIMNNSVFQLVLALTEGSVSKGRLWIETERIVERDTRGNETGLVQVQIRIWDNGGGVKPDILPQLGQLGFTTKSVNGSGYALFAAREYFESVDGLITWENRDGGFLVEVSVPEFNAEIHGDKRFSLPKEGADR